VLSASPAMVLPGLQASEHNTIRDDRSLEERANSVAAATSHRVLTRKPPAFHLYGSACAARSRVAPKEFGDTIRRRFHSGESPACSSVRRRGHGRATSNWPRGPGRLRLSGGIWPIIACHLPGSSHRRSSTTAVNRTTDNTIVIFRRQRPVARRSRPFGKQNAHERGGPHNPLVLAAWHPRGRSDALAYLVRLRRSDSGTPILAVVESKSPCP
jgi:hypothetical protein